MNYDNDNGVNISHSTKFTHFRWEMVTLDRASR